MTLPITHTIESTSGEECQLVVVCVLVSNINVLLHRLCGETRLLVAEYVCCEAHIIMNHDLSKKPPREHPFDFVF